MSLQLALHTYAYMRAKEHKLYIVSIGDVLTGTYVRTCLLALPPDIPHTVPPSQLLSGLDLPAPPCIPETHTTPTPRHTPTYVLSTCRHAGALVPFTSREDVDFFQHLEMHLRQENPPLTGRDHLAFRGSYLPVKDVIDGDLCEQFSQVVFFAHALPVPTAAVLLYMCGAWSGRAHHAEYLLDVCKPSCASSYQVEA